jgi:PAS domain S-box-containing protein
MKPMNANQLRILAIDDQRDNLTTLEAVLADALPGCQLLTASDGPRGIAMAREADPDAILLDIVMPDMDGFEVCRRLKADERLRDIPVVFLTALGTDRETRVKALEAGAEAFVTKPPDELELLAQIRAMAKLKTAHRMRRLERDELAALVAERTHHLEQELAARKRAEDALRESAIQLQKIFDILPIGLWFADKTGKLLRGNPAGVNIWGAEPCVDPSQYGVFKARRLPSGEEIAPDDWALAHTIREGTTTLDELLEIDAFDGRKKIILNSTAPVLDDDGAVLGAVIVNQDITLRKRFEAALSASEERYRVSFEMAAVGKAWTSLEGRLLRVNKAFADMLGYAPDELLGKAFTEITHPEDRESSAAAVRSMIAGEKSLLFEKRYLHKDGSTVWVNVAVAAVRNAGGELDHFIVDFLDISMRRQAEREQQLISEELRQRNEELERFHYTASHDLRSPAVTFQTFLGFLERDLKSGDAVRIRNDLNHLGAASGKMVARLDDLLHLSRLGRIEDPPGRFTLHELVGEVQETLAGTIALREVRIDVRGPDLALSGDRRRLSEIWQNLVENAIKFMGDQPDPRIEIGVDAECAPPVFYVRDNGIGIDPRFLGRIFDVFEKLDARSVGSGIGLAIVKRLVESKGGQIRVESAGPGQGTCFHFTLPGAVAGPEVDSA